VRSSDRRRGRDATSPAGVEARCGYGEDEVTSLLPRLAALCPGFAATVRFTNAVVSFGHTQAVDAPCVVTATAFVANPDHVARQHAVLSDACDGSATRAIKLSHAYDTVDRERRPSLARATSPGSTSFGAKAHPGPADGATKHSTLHNRQGPASSEVLVCPDSAQISLRFLCAPRCWNWRSTEWGIYPNAIHSRLNGGPLKVGPSSSRTLGRRSAGGAPTGIVPWGPR
jgi:hypothetical protein